MYPAGSSETDQELLQKEKITEQQIQRIVIAGNTTMCHLLRGFSCETLGVAPFLPVDLSWMEGSLCGFSWNERIGYKSCDFAWDLSVCRG